MCGNALEAVATRLTIGVGLFQGEEAPPARHVAPVPGVGAGRDEQHAAEHPHPPAAAVTGVREDACGPAARRAAADSARCTATSAVNASPANRASGPAVPMGLAPASPRPTKQLSNSEGSVGFHDDYGGSPWTPQRWAATRGSLSAISGRRGD